MGRGDRPHLIERERKAAAELEPAPRVDVLAIDRQRRVEIRVVVGRVAHLARLACRARSGAAVDAMTGEAAPVDKASTVSLDRRRRSETFDMDVDRNVVMRDLPVKEPAPHGVHSCLDGLGNYFTARRWPSVNAVHACDAASATHCASSWRLLQPLASPDEHAASK